MAHAPPSDFQKLAELEEEQNKIRDILFFQSIHGVSQSNTFGQGRKSTALGSKLGGESWFPLEAAITDIDLNDIATGIFDKLNLQSIANVIVGPAGTLILKTIQHIADGKIFSVTPGTGRTVEITPGGNIDVSSTITLQDTDMAFMQFFADTGKVKVVSSTASGTVPSGSAVNDHLEWDNTGMVWVAQQFLEFQSGNHPAIGDLRFKNNTINLAFRNFADDGDVEIKLDTNDFLDITENNNGILNLRLRSQHAVNPDNQLLFTVGSGAGGLITIQANLDLGIEIGASTIGIWKASGLSLNDNNLEDVTEIHGRDDGTPFKIVFDQAEDADTFISDDTGTPDRINVTAGGSTFFSWVGGALPQVGLLSGVTGLLTISDQQFNAAARAVPADGDLGNDEINLYFDTNTDPGRWGFKRKTTGGVVDSKIFLYSPVDFDIEFTGSNTDIGTSGTPYDASFMRRLMLVSGGALLTGSVMARNNAGDFEFNVPLTTDKYRFMFTGGNTISLGVVGSATEISVDTLNTGLQLQLQPTAVNPAIDGIMRHVTGGDVKVFSGGILRNFSNLNNTMKGSVRIATEANDTLSGLAARDGITPVAGDRVLVKEQTSGQNNGIYDAASGAWSRSSDYDDSDKATSGTLVLVQEGTANADKAFQLTTNEPITLGTTVLVYAEFGAGGGGNEFSDALFRIFDDIDTSRKLAFQTGGIAGSTTRTWTVPNRDGTIVVIDNTTGDLEVGVDVVLGGSNRVISGATSGVFVQLDTSGITFESEVGDILTFKVGTNSFFYNGSSFDMNAADVIDVNEFRFVNPSLKIISSGSGLTIDTLSGEFIRFTPGSTLEVDIDNFFLRIRNTSTTSPPQLVLHFNDSSPVANGPAGSILFDAEDTASNQQTYASISVESDTVTSGSERGRLQLNVATGSSGSLVNGLVIEGDASTGILLGFRGALPQAARAWTDNGTTILRTISDSSTTTQVRQALDTLIGDLEGMGILG